MDKGIKVMCWDDPMTNTDADWVLDNQALGNEIGRLAGEFISAHYDNENKAQVAIIEYNDVAILLDRADGIKAGLEESAAGKYTIVAEEPGLDPKGAQASMERILASNPECKIAVGIGSGAMIGSNEAFMNYYDSVIPSEVGVITTDVTKRQLNAIVSDEACRGIIGFEGSDEDTAEAAMAMFSLLIDNNVGAHEVYRNVAPITTENCASILEEMK